MELVLAGAPRPSPAHGPPRHAVLSSARRAAAQLPHKPFYTVFKLAGFTSFDGQFQA